MSLGNDHTSAADTAQPTRAYHTAALAVGLGTATFHVALDMANSCVVEEDTSDSTARSKDL